MVRKKNKHQNDIAYENYVQGYNLIKQHPMFSPLLAHVQDIRREGNLYPEDGWAVITSSGYLHIHPTRRMGCFIILDQEVSGLNLGELWQL